MSFLWLLEGEAIIEKQEQKQSLCYFNHLILTVFQAFFVAAVEHAV